MLSRYLRRAAPVFASLWLVTTAAPAGARHDAVLRALLADVESGLEALLLSAPATPATIAGRVEALIARLRALHPPPATLTARRVADNIARAGHAALRARPVLPEPATVALPPGAVELAGDLDQAEGLRLRLPLPRGEWRILLFGREGFGDEMAVNGRRVAVAPGAGVLVLEATAGDDGVRIAFRAPLDLQRIVAEPAADRSLLGDALPTAAQRQAAHARIDAALATAAARQAA